LLASKKLAKPPISKAPKHKKGQVNTSKFMLATIKITRKEKGLANIVKK
jgi:hypothetical protein